MNNVRGYNKTIKCPYNESHQILAERFQTHLVKCRKQYPDSKKVQCPLNSIHLVNEQELDHHVRHDCSSRESLELWKTRIDTGASSMPQPTQNKMNKLNTEESWDDYDHPTYNPQKYCESAPVLRQLNVATPSEKNAFRDAERRRLGQLERND